MIKSLVSVVFPTFNRPAEAAKNIELLKLNISFPFEIIITDNSPEPADYKLRPGDTLVRTGRNMGAAARNIGVSAAKAPYILMLDDDSHPLPGAVDAAVAFLRSAPEHTGGVTAKIIRLDGGRENPPLLPTAFHGCGALFKTEALRKTGEFYPPDFCFYGEEYYSTLLLASAGYSLAYLDDFVVCHRMSADGRDRGRIIHQLALNNRRTWRPFVPAQWIEEVELDTRRRYELIAAKEKVPASFANAMTEKITEPSRGRRTLSSRTFNEVTLLSAFEAFAKKAGPLKGRTLIFCGCGKFPELWADFLEAGTGARVLLSDFNPGIAGRIYRKRNVLTPGETVATAKEERADFILGHSSRTDSLCWLDFLERNGLKDAVSSFSGKVLSPCPEIFSAGTLS